MAYRDTRTTEFEERDSYYPSPRRSRGGGLEVDEVDYRSRRAVTRSPPRVRRTGREVEELDVRVREREEDRTPAFLRQDARRTEAGPMVLRKRDIETYDRRRSPSPPPQRVVREQKIVRRQKSMSPPPPGAEFREVDRFRFTERERRRSPSEVRRRSPSPRPMRRRASSVDQEHIRIIERERERISSPSPSPSPPPPPPVIREPTIEREVITHYRDIDHGMTRARPASPPRQPRLRRRESETDIDISLSKNRTEVDIRRSNSRASSRPRERRGKFHDDELIVRRESGRESDTLIVDDYSGGRRRARSAAPLGSPVDEEADYITSRIDSRGRVGEAWGGATKDWAIVDVPPGTERVRMDGVGGGSTDTTWSKYSGVRRTEFIPERDGEMVPRRRERERDRGTESSSRTEIEVWDREREIDIDIERTKERRVSRPEPQPAPPREMWTEITKDLVVREAIIERGYEFEETPEFFYIMDYLRYEDVMQLTEMSEDIRRARKDRLREIKWERDVRDDWERRRPAIMPPMRREREYYRRPGGWDEERVKEREVIYDSRGPARGYIR